MNSTAFTVFVLPFLLGAIIRATCLKWKRGSMISAAFALLAVSVWLWTKHLADRGVDGTVMAWAWMAAELTVGSLLVGGMSRLLRRIGH